MADAAPAGTESGREAEGVRDGSETGAAPGRAGVRSGQLRGGNFVAILLCQFATFATFSSVMPFLPLYLRELGESETSAIVWSGAIQSAGAVVLLVATPLWGALSDRVGRKPMVQRSLVGAGVCMGLLALTTQAWHVLGLRLIQGATAGTNSAVIALAAAVLPPSRLGLGMGMLQTAQFLGISLGPFLGGLGSAALGFRWTFGAAAVMIVAIFALVTTFVREPPRAAETGAGRGGKAPPQMSLAERLQLVLRSPDLRGPLVIILSFQAAYIVGTTLLAVHIAAVVEGAGGTTAEGTTAVGLVLGANAVGAAVGATALGWLGGRVGERRVALLALAGTALLTLPQVWFTHPLQFAVLRVGIGFCAGGVLPALRAVLGHEAGKDTRTSGNLGAVYGLSQSAFAGGMVVGPSLASLVATTLGLPLTHLVSSIMLALAATWHWQLTNESSVASRQLSLRNGRSSR